MSDQPAHFEPVPLSIEQATHLFKHTCTPAQLADLQDGIDAIISVLTEIDGLDFYLTRATKSELETLAAALHAITDEPTVQFEGAAYQIVVPPVLNNVGWNGALGKGVSPISLVPGDDTQNMFALDDDDLHWLDPFRPDAP